MKRRKLSSRSVTGAVLFFFTISFVVTVAITVYGAVGDWDNKVNIALVVFGVIIVLATGATVAYRIYRHLHIIKPVREILDATDEIASGNFSVQLELSHSPFRFNEFDYIKENVNKIAAELSHTEVLHSDFVSNVSHEIKTPLAIIQNYASALEDPSLDAAKREEYARVLVGASKRLNELVSNILKLNKLENQEFSFEPEDVPLHELIAEAAISFEEIIEEKGLTLDCDLDEITVRSSSSHLEIMMNNLLSNAVKFTEKGGITLSLKRENGKAVIRVQDTGCGISPEIGGRIFDKFYQGDTSHATEGNGLGLALVKKIIDLLGGEIEVNSAPGKGSVFTVRLSAA